MNIFATDNNPIVLSLLAKLCKHIYTKARTPCFEQILRLPTTNVARKIFLVINYVLRKIFLHHNMMLQLACLITSGISIKCMQCNVLRLHVKNEILYLTICKIDIMHAFNG